MRAPAFWWQDESAPLARLLRPAGLIYGALAGRRMAMPGERAPLPVACIGNFTAGGAGKTPTALALAHLLSQAGERPAFLSRGYGGALPGPLRVGPRHTAAQVGDEPLLLAASGMAIISRDRPAGARLAQESGATAVIMDDGLQNPSLRKDCALAVVDGAIGIGNGLTLPAGPLRAPMAAQWPAVDAILVIGRGAAGEAMAREAERHGKRVFRGVLMPDPAQARALRGRRVLAFAGIGRPEKFFETLGACGAVVEAAHAFPDHHPYTPGELAELRQEAEREGLLAVTTEKDLARIAGPDRAGLTGLAVRLWLEDEAGLRDLVLGRIHQRRREA
jgi:tetraacyldisaccharide 4'-kinase